MPTPLEILEAAYSTAVSLPPISDLYTPFREKLAPIIAYSENQKGVLAALITSLVKKVETPSQDIRLHKTVFPGGYSGRSYDTVFVTPFIRQKFGRLGMAESGWLTRSIEQPHPFTLDFPGKIQNQAVREAFLQTLHDVEVNQAPANIYLIALLQGLIEQTANQTKLVIPRLGRPIPIGTIMGMLQAHFETRATGTALLPVLALYSIHQTMLGLPRYIGKNLLPLKSHTTPDSRSKSIGDIEITHVDGRYFEAVEVKFGKPITADLIQIAAEKFLAHPIERYYLLTTATPNILSPDEINRQVEDIRQKHGCEVIVNGVIPTLKYYLRLLPDPAIFIETYTQALYNAFEQASDIKAVHLERWNQLMDDL